MVGIIPRDNRDNSQAKCISLLNKVCSFMLCYDTYMCFTVVVVESFTCTGCLLLPYFVGFCSYCAVILELSGNVLQSSVFSPGLCPCGIPARKFEMVH